MTYPNDPGRSPGNYQDVTPDDVDAFEDVPTYGEAGSTSRIRPRETPQAPVAGFEPTEVFAPATETVALDRQPVEVPPAPPADAYVEPEVIPADPVAVAPARRGTIDFGLFVLRLLVGGFLVLHSVQVFFRLGASDGIPGLENAFSAYAYGDVLAIVVPTLELAAGVFLVLGLVTPAAAMVALTATGFMAAHAAAASGLGLNVLAWDPAVWLPVVLFGGALALQFTGPGFYSVDSGRSWASRPLASSWIFAVLGIAAAALMWWFGTGINPVA